MSLTRKIGAYLCTAAMVFSLNVKSNALVKEILQGVGIFGESLATITFWCCFLRSIKKDAENPENEGNKENNGNTKGFFLVSSLFLTFDVLQRSYFLAFGDSNSKTEKTDNKELNKKNEKKVENA